MAIILPNSTFFHIGRTGGHWINHVLWQGGLVRRRIVPLHLTPAQLDRLVPDRPTFSFCFVRHPLRWAASLWRHELEHGWSDSEASRIGESERFDDFLERLVAAFPAGACDYAMTPYTARCDTVGRLESVATDLGAALARAGEAFDPAILSAPAMNESQIATLKCLARAPEPVLRRFMEADAGFCERFGYRDIPAEMIGEGGPAWPRLPARRDTADRPIDHLRARFRYTLDDGRVAPGAGAEQRLQWSLIDLAARIGDPGRCAVVSEVDPYPALLLARATDTPVTMVAAHPDAVPRSLIGAIAADIMVVGFAEFRQADARYDTILLVDSAELNPMLQDELLAAAAVLRPGGLIALTAPEIRSDAPIATTLPAPLAVAGSRKLVYRSFAELRILLENSGFEAVERIDSASEVLGTEAARAHVERLADDIRTDPDGLLGRMTVIARRCDAPAGDFREQWLARRSIDLSVSPGDFLTPHAQARLLDLEAAVRALRLRAELAEQGLADREQELRDERHSVRAMRIDSDFQRASANRAVATEAATRAELEQLRATLRTFDIVAHNGCDSGKDD